MWYFRNSLTNLYTPDWGGGPAEGVRLEAGRRTARRVAFPAKLAEAFFREPLTGEIGPARNARRMAHKGDKGRLVALPASP